MIFIVRLHVYPFDIMVSAGDTDEELEKELKRYDVPFGDHCRLGIKNPGRCISFPGKQILIRMKEIPDQAEFHGFLAHEIFHAVYNVMGFTGIKLSEKSEEAWSYLIGYVTKEIYNQFYDFDK